MKRIFSILVLMLLASSVLIAREDSVLTAKLLSGISSDSIRKTVEDLSGATRVRIGDAESQITTRLYGSEGNALARTYLMNRLEAYGLMPIVLDNHEDVSIYAEKSGSSYSDEYVVICAHYDNISKDTGWVHGADDNASGVAAVIEAARLFQDVNTNYSIIFALWDNEEHGLYGSYSFASHASETGMRIRYLINLDMIGYCSANNMLCNIDVDTVGDNSAIPELINKYPANIPYSMGNYRNGSDHLSFWYYNYPGIMLSEDFTLGMNPYYHSVQDQVSTLNFVQAAKIAHIAYSLLGYYAEIIPRMISADESGRQFDRFHVYPNPTRGEFECVFNSATDDVAELTVYNQLGEPVITRLQALEPKSGLSRIGADISSFADGVYFVRLRSASSQHCFKIIKAQ